MASAPGGGRFAAIEAGCWDRSSTPARIRDPIGQGAVIEDMSLSPFT